MTDTKFPELEEREGHSPAGMIAGIIVGGQQHGQSNMEIAGRIIAAVKAILTPNIANVPRPEHPTDLKTCPCHRCRSERDKLSGAVFSSREVDMFPNCWAGCGNKRCPGAADHNNACTNSNEPGQKGSLYE